MTNKQQTPSWVTPLILAATTTALLALGYAFWQFSDVLFHWMGIFFR